MFLRRDDERVLERFLLKSKYLGKADSRQELDIKDLLDRGPKL